MNKTQRNEEIKNLREQNISLRKIGEMYGISGARVLQILQEEQNRKPEKCKESKYVEHAATIRIMREKGETWDEISRKLGIPKTMAHRLKSKTDTRETKSKQIINPEIKLLREAGLTWDEISKRLNIPRSTVYRQGTT